MYVMFHLPALILTTTLMPWILISFAAFLIYLSSI
uniref:Uncharacterized protein n=1 Tax=Arundo donax TaxID=35708 RepID=A0A0A9CB04_ARUDO